jgi:hypothetical protein
VSLRTLQEWMGHARMSTTEIYADFMPADNEAALVEAAFARSPGGPLSGTVVHGQFMDNPEGN